MRTKMADWARQLPNFTKRGSRKSSAPISFPNFKFQERTGKHTFTMTRSTINVPVLVCTTLLQVMPLLWYWMRIFPQFYLPDSESCLALFAFLTNLKLPAVYQRPYKKNQTCLPVRKKNVHFIKFIYIGVSPVHILFKSISFITQITADFIVYGFLLHTKRKLGNIRYDSE